MRQPRSSTPPWACLERAPAVLADLRLRVVTPMFGGGVEPGYLDKDFLIRPSAIRGHLRFWWRACNAAAIPTVKDLHKRERALWGSAAKKNDSTFGPGAIGIQITEVVPGTKFTHQGIPRPGRRDRMVWRREGDTSEDQLGPDYALFPFVYQREAQRPALPGMVDITFRLKLAVQSHAGNECSGGPSEQECMHAVEQALWAWITFGGIGSRTRRGCGSLACITNDDTSESGALLSPTLFIPDSADIVGWLLERHDALVEIGAELPSVPNLGGARIQIKPPKRNAISAWHASIDPMFRFRQGRNDGRNQGGRTPGQSRWPEPGAVRELCDISNHEIDSEDHEYTRTPNADGRDFPRADLGLPILFQNMRPGGQPPTLEGATEGFTRMASPIILKTIAVDDTTWIPVALLLEAPHVWDKDMPGVHLNDQRIGVPIPLVPPALGPMNRPNFEPHWPAFPHGTTPPKPKRVDGNASARDAFMDYFGGEQVL